MSVKAKKLKMTHIFEGSQAMGVTPVLVRTAEDIASFATGDAINVRGITKGKGFQGTVKRHGFRGGPKTHGQKNRHRAPGSIGNTATQRVVPGRKMAGRMGGVNRTTKNIKVVRVDADARVIFLYGAVPGNTGNEILIRKQ
jgi:large subunit ribosomal protein L3